MIDDCAVEFFVYNIWLDDFDLYPKSCQIVIVYIKRFASILKSFG